uniref:charged multivesicular body protein 4b-like n=1 Tax=Halichoerus grypus TaxID=9711 RepID=UPI001658CD48|nr:charged multivesicular body protein 4b-like [Halichoerus grypus]
MEEMLSKKQEFLEMKIGQELTAMPRSPAQKQARSPPGPEAKEENAGSAAKAMKAAHDNMDIDKADELMQDIADQQELAEEISTAISQPVGFGEEFDEDELMLELEELEREEPDKNLLEIRGPKTVPLPNVPSITLPSKPTKKKEEEEDDMKELENWAGSI